MGASLVTLWDLEEDLEDLLEFKKNRKNFKMALRDPQESREYPERPQETQGAPRISEGFMGASRVQEAYEGGNLVSPLKSTLVVGQPGAGKGLLVWDALESLKKSQPDIRIWGIPMKDDPEEVQARWGACDELYPDPLPAFGDTHEWQSGADEFVQDFAESRGPKLLIIDEALGLKERTGSWWKGFVSSANHMASTGRSQRIYVWILSQTPNAGDFGVSGGARNVFRRILLIHSEDKGILQNRTTFATYPGPEELKKLFRKSDRIVYDSLRDKWEPLGEISDPSIGIYREPENPEGLTRILQRTLESPEAPGMPEGLWSLLKTPRIQKDIQRYWGKERGLTSEETQSILREQLESGRIRFDPVTKKYETS
jgi:hypothetical protein